MSKKQVQGVLDVLDGLLDGTEATAPEPANVRGNVLDFAIRLLHVTGDNPAACASLRDLMTGCYHLGRRQAIERVAIGLDTVAMQTPEPEGMPK